MTSSREWVTSIQRLCWGVVHLSAQPWLSPAEAQSLLDVRVVAEQLLGVDWQRYAGPALIRELAAVVKAVGDRGEGPYLREWHASGVAVCRLVFEQRQADLDAELASRRAELDAVWERTVADVGAMSATAVNDLCRGAGELIAGAGETVGRGLGAFLEGLFQSPLVVGALIVGGVYLFGKGGRK